MVSWTWPKVKIKHKKTHFDRKSKKLCPARQKVLAGPASAASDFLWSYWTKRIHERESTIYCFLQKCFKNERINKNFIMDLPNACIKPKIKPQWLQLFFLTTIIGLLLESFHCIDFTLSKIIKMIEPNLTLPIIPWRTLTQGNIGDLN
jgi:hypothetical protein